jgi:hypothetical protein
MCTYTTPKSATGFRSLPKGSAHDRCRVADHRIPHDLRRDPARRSVRLSDRASAASFLDWVLELLAGEHVAKGRSGVFNRLKVILTQGKGAVPGATLPAQLGTTEGAVHTAVHRPRKRHREILREQIEATLRDPSEMDDEIRSLFDAVRS